jgi:hypothetical protein
VPFLDGLSQLLVAHACNPTYSGGRDQEVGGSMTTQANTSQRPYFKITNTKKSRQSELSGRTPA